LAGLGVQQRLSQRLFAKRRDESVEVGIVPNIHPLGNPPRRRGQRFTRCFPAGVPVCEILQDFGIGHASPSACIGPL
jgi:hypothetical protein